jgi:hypothetical protein
VPELAGHDGTRWDEGSPALGEWASPRRLQSEPFLTDTWSVVLASPEPYHPRSGAVSRLLETAPS